MKKIIPLSLPFIYICFYFVGIDSLHIIYCRDIIKNLVYLLSWVVMKTTSLYLQSLVLKSLFDLMIEDSYLNTS